MRVLLIRVGVLLGILSPVLFLVAGRPVVVSAQSAAPPANGASARDPIRCLVLAIEEVKVPAQEAGVLKTLLVEEGDMVMPDQQLAQIDDTRAQMQLTAADLKLKVARTQAANTTNVEYAKAAADVAHAEWIQADDANKKVPGAVTTAEMRRLALTYHRTKWEIKQAEEDLLIAGLQADVSQAELDAAADNLARRKILSPLEGEVLQVHSHAGEWVEAGDPVLEIVRVNRLWVEGFLSATDYTPGELKGRSVTVRATLAHGRVEPFTGMITFVSPVVEQGNRRRVRATVENRKEGDEWLLSVRMPAEMTIEGITAK